MFQYLFNVGTYNSPPPIKTNRIFRIFPGRIFMFFFLVFKKGLTVLGVLLTQQILLFAYTANSFI